MTMREWLITRKPSYSPEHALCICMASDGLSLTNNKPMAVSIMGPDIPAKTFYIGGAEASKVEQYTGVGDTYYREKEQHTDSVLTELNRYLTNVDFLVSFTVDTYQKKWLDITFPSVLRDIEILDVVNVVKLVDAREQMPINIDTVDDLHADLHKSFRGVKGYSMDDVCGRCVPGFMPADVKQNKLEKKVVDLYNLWTATLDRVS